MSGTLKDYLKGLIKHRGAIAVSEYMELCLTHPQYGYYSRHQPIGRKGDFVTAPEVSQMFGELIGLWVANIWHNMGKPNKLYLAELGGGYGTLMADMLRAQRVVPGLHDALEIYMVEISDHLSQIQKEKLKNLGYDIPLYWHKDFCTIPDDAPIIFVGNEFFDALPVHHLQMQLDSWYERRIGLDENDNLIFTLSRESVDPPTTHPAVDDAKDGDILEFSTLGLSLMMQIAERINKQNGAALFADYGYAFPHTGESLQAVKEHQYVDVLAYPGECDLTAHVDFGALAQVAYNHNVKILPLLAQAMFLNSLGITERAQSLKNNAPQAIIDAIDSQLHRLTDAKQMGNLFKIFMLGNRNLPMPFDQQDEIWGKELQLGSE